MADIALKQLGVGNFGVSLNAGSTDLLADEGLETAVTISLFTDARTSGTPPDGSDDPRGWWGNIGDTDGVKTGSLLWLLWREKITPQTIADAKAYCEKALQWMIDDGIARTVTVITERSGLYQINIGIDIAKPTGQNLRYSYLWGGQALAEQGRA